MNRQLQKIESQHNQTTHKAEQTLNTRTKGKSRKFKENYKRGKDYLIITKKHRMENSQDGNE